MHLRTAFVRKTNANGSHEALCLGCFATVGSVKDEAELTRYEISHHCIPVQFNQSGHGPVADRQLELSTREMP